MAEPRDSPPPEDTVFYKLFPAVEERGDAEKELDLTCLAVKCSDLAKKLTEDHVWHYESFQLGVCLHVTTDPNHPPLYLGGSLCYRDNVEDEWCVVWLLLEISKHFPHLVISVGDEDGEFLLIETAHHLPGWLRPDTAQNRVFLGRGALHIIPQPRTPAEVSRYPVATPTLREAIKLVSDPATPTEATQVVQEALQHRISCFPAAIQTHLHRAHCYLPWPVGHMMSCDPSLVSAAVHALCDRGPEEMKAVRSMKHFSPSTHPCLMSQVKFTRCLYAKLLHLRFNPPPHSGFMLAPPTSHTHKPHELGMKLACGLEIVVSGERGDEGRGGGSHSLTDTRWRKFLKNLQENDYFQGEVEGSQRHQQLMTSARDYFLTTLAAGGEETRHRDPVRAAGVRAKQLMVSNPGSEEDMRQRSLSLPPSDDDGWLEISPGELDDMMRKAAGYLPREGARKEGGRQVAVEEMVRGVKSFVGTVSSHEGAEFPWRGERGGGGVEMDVDSVLQALREEEEGSDEGESGDEGDIGEEGEEEEEEEGMRDLMEQMAQQLKTAGFRTSLGQEEEEDIGMMTNLLSSLATQPEAAGPASNILHSLGIPVPDPD